MERTVTIDLSLFMISIVILIIFVLYFQQQPPIIIKQDEKELDKENNINAHDVVRNWDHRVLDDPLLQPNRRMPIQNYPRDINHPLYKYTEIATKGYPDSFNYYGTLVRSDDNKFLKLFGREKFPGSTQFEYYAIWDEGGSQLKIPIDFKNNKELYDGEEIDIDMMDPTKGKFKVYITKQDELRYNPFLY